MPFEKIHFDSKEIVGLRAVGKITQEDYTKTLFPILDEARKSGKKLKLLLKFGSRFDGYTMEAIWEDSKFGLRYVRAIEKLAIVTDIPWLGRLSSLFGSLIPCPVKVFNCGQTEAAKAWIEYGKDGLTYDLDGQSGVLTINIFSPLSSHDFEVVSDVADSYIERGGELKGIVIKAEKFPGWEDFGSFVSHFEFVKGHHKKVDRVALVADGVMAKSLPAIGRHFVDAEVQRFDSEQLFEARHWASGDEASEERIFGPERDSEQSQRGELQ